MNIFPGTNPSDVSGVYALMSFLSDPKAHATRLQELKQVADDAQAKLDQQGINAQNLDKAKAEYAKNVEELQNKHTEADFIKSNLDRQLQEFIKNKQDFDTYQTSVKSDLSSKISALVDRENSVLKESAAVSTLNIKAQSEYDAYLKLRMEYEAKLAQLKAAIA